MKATRPNLIVSLATMHPSRHLLERRIAEMGLGVISALSRGEINYDQAEHDLFNLDNYVEIRRRRLSSSLLQFFERGMQLEDVSEIGPQNVTSSFEKMNWLADQIIRRAARDLPRSTKLAQRRSA
ncbi:MAG TPA: DUF3969 family protein [Tepidisphaeraceae bacterium]|jgi:hypothetical protein|nr:DUF3969 family protein [Tepidisphaeraceae bacterium]